MNTANVIIKKAKGGYRVYVTGSNNEILSTSEVLKTKANAFKNIGAQQKAFDSTSATVVLDETNNTKYLVYASGRKTKI